MSEQPSEHFTANATTGDGRRLDTIDPRSLPPDTIWMGFSLDSDPAAIRTAFEKRHGYPPAYITRFGPSILAGPIREATRAY